MWTGRARALGGLRVKRSPLRETSGHLGTRPPRSGSPAP